MPVFRPLFQLWKCMLVSFAKFTFSMKTLRLWLWQM